MTVKVTISLPDDLAKFADKLASESGRARSQIIADMLRARWSEVAEHDLEEAYAEMAEENLKFARESFHLAAEIWDPYEWKPPVKAQRARSRRRK